jgi:hypothetical protein
MFLYRDELSKVSYSIDGYQYRVMAVNDYSDERRPYDYALSIFLHNSNKFNCLEFCKFFNAFLNNDSTYSTISLNSDSTYSTINLGKINSSSLRNKDLRIFFYSDNVLKYYAIKPEKYVRVENDTFRCVEGDTLIVPDCVN